MVEKSKIKDEKEAKKYEEKLSILAKADEIKGEQLVISSSGELKSENELKNIIASGDFEDPEKKYELYYKGLMKILKDHLPKGKYYKKARKYVYEEKNTFLTRGKRINENGKRGADSRMSYNSDCEILLSIIIEWVTNKGTMLALFNNLRDLNVSKGYGSPKL